MASKFTFKMRICIKHRTATYVYFFLGNWTCKLFLQVNCVFFILPNCSNCHMCPKDVDFFKNLVIGDVNFCCKQQNSRYKAKEQI